MKLLLKVVQLMLMVTLLTACDSSDELTWTEDVKLPDGRVITLKRWVEFKGAYAMGDTPNESRQRLEFKHPVTGETVKWENAEDTGMLRTIALLLDNGTPVLLTEPNLGQDFRYFKCPNPPYLLFEYAAGQWRNKPLVQISVRNIRSNITSRPKQKREEIEAGKRHLTVEQTRESYTSSSVAYQVPYVIAFDNMPTQTFSDADCSRPSNINDLISTKRQ
jgi:hypothetical protein